MECTKPDAVVDVKSSDVHPMHQKNFYLCYTGVGVGEGCGRRLAGEAGESFVFQAGAEISPDNLCAQGQGITRYYKELFRPVYCTS